MDSTKNESNTEKVVKSRVLSIPGTKPNVQNAQLLISTGIPSLDILIGIFKKTSLHFQKF